MKKMWNDHKIIIIIAALVLVAVLYLYVWPMIKSAQAAALPKGAPGNAADQACVNQILNWVATNDPQEYTWWQQDIALYMPGGARSAIGQYGITADLPGNQVSNSMRVKQAMNELKYSRDTTNTTCKVTDVDAFNFVQSVYGPYILSQTV